MKDAKLNVPNVLSAYRLLALPFIVAAIYHGDRKLFIILLSINLITDILDGFIARRFKLETEFGARLDSMADIGTMLMALSGMIVFEWDFVTTHSIAFSILIGLYILFEICGLLRFGRFPSLHLYSSKVTGYLQGIFIFSYFVFGYQSWYFYTMVVFSCLTYLEAITVIFYLKELRSNCKGLYWLLASN